MLFDGDKFHNIGVVNSLDPHVSPSSRATLFNNLGGHIENLHERDRPTCYSSCGLNGIVFGSQSAEGEACSPSTLMNEGCLFHCLKDGIKGVFNGKDKAGS
jgi:hypothetical protein